MTLLQHTFLVFFLELIQINRNLIDLWFINQQKMLYAPFLLAFLSYDYLLFQNPNKLTNQSANMLLFCFQIVIVSSSFFFVWYLI